MDDGGDGGVVEGGGEGNVDSGGEGKVVVVTGGNEGIGHHVLRTLLEDGYRVACFDVAVDGVEPLRESHPRTLRAFECDVTVDDDVESAVGAVLEEWGRIDILVNNAAVFNFGRFENQTLADTRREFEVNLFGSLRLVHAVLPHMRERGEGIIHNVGSGAGAVGHPGLSGYASTKAAIEGFTRSLRHELDGENVACTLMYPSLARTRSASRLGYAESAFEDPAVVGRKLARRIESRKAVIHADWKTRLGVFLARRFPALVVRGTGWVREMDDGGTVEQEPESPPQSE